MLRFEQLDFLVSLVAEAVNFPAVETEKQGRPAAFPAISLFGRDGALEAKAREMLQLVDARRLIPLVQVEWNPRLRTAAGRADFQKKRICLNPRLHDHGAAEIDRTLRHELAHLLAQFRAGRRRISPHGLEWHQACRDLGSRMKRAATLFRSRSTIALDGSSTSAQIVIAIFREHAGYVVRLLVFPAVEHITMARSTDGFDCGFVAAISDRRN